jgi:hypothetical protein
MYFYCFVCNILCILLHFVVLCIVCKCVSYYCHRMSTQQQLTNISIEWVSPYGGLMPCLSVSHEGLTTRCKIWSQGFSPYRLYLEYESGSLSSNSMGKRECQHCQSVLITFMQLRLNEHKHEHIREHVNQLAVSEIPVPGKPLCLSIALHHLITTPVCDSWHERVLTKEVCFFFRRSLPANGQPTPQPC